MLSIDIVRALYPRAPREHVDAFAAQNGGLFAQYGISDKPLRLQHFLAQIGHESGGLTIMEENMNYRAERLREVWPSRFTDMALANRCAGNPELLANTVYCDRMGNGNSASGDGWRYRGRGYIQITGRDGYRNVGAQAGLDLEGNPDLAFAPDRALAVACGFWRWKDLNTVSDTGDFVAVTRRINGGINGLADRKAWFDKVRRVLGAPVPMDEQPDAPDVVAIQRRLQALGYRELGAADGIIGPRTAAAITRFRHDKGLGNGMVDAALLQALGL
ncbi:MAG: glycoside hydrolase family 19 protein [Alphaproteobacteria bacterium]|nr:glycoside hydrolase family 19 protein [Alphaproteobacteria bacterium]